MIEAFNVSFDQRTMRLRLSYSPPRTEIPALTPQHTCDSVNRISPGQCRVVGPDRIDVDLITAILRGTGAAR
ncbi:hypothetical protein [Tsukamurella spumae]|uniref:Uncharacterized protein n=1 Tax=Tsukamurella spumae TaxID=44753 RepID=A0A846WXB6_9ACTN|nr:hypothetical protein [Tsukamurella spumae]NKY17633.1 hypothetical protein [Tsukamurella spumae]